MDSLPRSMDHLPKIVIQTDTPPLLELHEDGQWTLEFNDAGAAVILSGEQVRRINTDYLDQMMGGPLDSFEEDRAT
jgi:hypothetical protein